MSMNGQWVSLETNCLYCPIQHQLSQTVLFNCVFQRTVLERVAQYYCFVEAVNCSIQACFVLSAFRKNKIYCRIRTKYSSCITMACVVCVFLVSNEATYISFTVWPKPCSLCCNGFCSMNYHSVMLLKKSVVKCIEEETQPKVCTYIRIEVYIGMCVCVVFVWVGGWAWGVCGVCGVHMHPCICSKRRDRQRNELTGHERNQSTHDKHTTLCMLITQKVAYTLLI